MRRVTSWAEGRALVRLKGTPQGDDGGSKQEGAGLPAGERAWRLEQERDALHRVLDLLALGILLVDEKGTVLWSNHRGRELLDARDGIYLSEGRLKASRTADTAALLALVASAARAGVGAAIHEAGVLSLTRPSMPRPLLVVVEPLPTAAGSEGGTPAAIVFVRNLELAFELHETVLRHCFELTGAEARLASSLLRGLSLKDAAAQCGITVHTARGHLKRIFGKTGTNSQSGLIRILLGALGWLRSR